MPTGWKIVRLTQEHLPGAIEVLRQSFFPDEKVCCAVRILQDSPIVPDETKYKSTVGSLQLEALCIDTVKDGVSFVGIDETTGEVLGVAFNKIQVKPPPGQLSYFEVFAQKNVTDPSAQNLVDFMIEVDSRFDLFEKAQIDCLMEVMFLGVKSTANGRGIGTGLVKASAEFAQQLKDKNEGKTPDVDVRSPAKENQHSEALGSIPKCVSAIFSSRFSQMCGRRSGFEEALVIPYTDFKYNGRSYADTIGPEHPSAIFEFKRLD